MGGYGSSLSEEEPSVEENEEELVTIVLKAPSRRRKRQKKRTSEDDKDDDEEDGEKQTEPLPDNGGKRSRRIAKKDPEIQLRVYGKDGDPPDQRWRKRAAAANKKQDSGSAGESRRVRFEKI